MSKLQMSLIGIVIAAIVSMTVSFNSINAEPVVMDINKAMDPGPGFGEEKIGTVSIDAQNRTLDLSINMTAMPKPDKVFEAWLVDADGSNYKLSLGAIEGGSLKTSEHMVNPYTYTEFIVTEEPKDDVDPNAAGTYGGAELQAPFGR
ncbi:MAG TPA: anti-sigma factor [Candidatus Saccharimonadales bacterium]|nr:anti-sigma factor [Candidatus Saccharimonadales bacterium]